MASQRQQKFQKLYQKELAEIFQQDSKHAFSNRFITVTDVEVSPDLSFAKVFLSFLAEKDIDAAMEDIDSKKSFIRGQLSKRVGKQVRIIPELAFFHDNTAEEASRIEKLLKNLNIPPGPEEEK